MSESIYARAVKELFDATYGTLADRDRIKVAQLFDRLLDQDIRMHVDDLRRLCRQAGYDEHIADDIGLIYDDLVLYRDELESPNTIDYWPTQRMQQIISGDS